MTAAVHGKDQTMTTIEDAKHALLYRMATEQHLCPFGLKARDLLQRAGFAVEDHKLTSRAETDAFMAEHHVETTPQVFIGGPRIWRADRPPPHFRQAGVGAQT